MSSNSGLSLFVPATLIAAALSGCVSLPPETETRSAAFHLPTGQYQSSVQLQSQQLLLAPNAQGPSTAQQAAIYDLMTKWRAAPGGAVVVETPTGATNETYAATAKIDEFMQAYGLTEPHVQFRRYEADPTAAIRVTFPIYAVNVPRCGLRWENLAKSDNQSTSDFGCATTANLAAMVSNPADMLSPRASTPIDASRRQTVLEKYRKGEITSSARDEQARGVVSQAVD